ncbi:MAG: helix-hairpin-helix domain-containing protein [Ardenticatenaceae bacterium]|nr:helix-hairpin-helix domain-containing protein [Ardenticatenaceae bacterium]
METLIALLAMAVGAAAGVLLALLLDGYSLGRMLNTAVSHNQELNEQAHTAEKALAVANYEVRNLKRQWQESSARAKELLQENQTVQNRLTAAAVAVKTQKQTMVQLQRQLQLREAEYQRLCQRLSELEVQLQRQQQLLLAAQQERDNVAAALQREKRIGNGRPASSSVAADGLQTIHGIGPTYARRLRDEGIVSVADLIQHSPEHLAEIVGLKGGLAQKTADWLQQAHEIIGER